MKKRSRLENLYEMLTLDYGFLPTVQEVIEIKDSSITVLECSDFEFAMKDNESLFVSITKENQPKMKKLIKSIKKIMDYKTPICSYEIDDNEHKLCLEWNLSNPEQRMQEVMENDSFFGGKQKLCHVKLYNLCQTEQSKEKKQVENLDEFCELFLTKYYLRTRRDENDTMLSFSPYFQESLMILFHEGDNQITYEHFNLIEPNRSEVDMDKVMSKIRYSHVRKYWADEYIYSVEDNKIKTEINIDTINSISNKYNIVSEKLVNSLVTEFIRIEKNQLFQKKVNYKSGSLSNSVGRQ